MSINEPEFRKYLRPNRLPLALGVIFAVIAACSLVFAGLSFAGIIHSAKKEEAVKFDPTNSAQEGCYVYVDVLATDSWAVKSENESFYLVLDDEGVFTLVAMDEARYNSLQPQQEYWNGYVVEKKEMVRPTPERLYGVAVNISSEVNTNLGKAYSWTSSQAAEAVGTYYMDEGAIPGTDERTGSLIIAAVAGFFAIIFIFSYRHRKKSVDKSMERLNGQGNLDRAWGELHNYRQQMGEQALSMTENFVVSKKEGHVFAYNDIVWIYRFVQKRNFITVNSHVVCYLKDGSCLQVFNNSGWGKKDKLEEIFQTINAKNPQAMIGYTSDNIRAYKAMTKKN